MNRWFVRIFWVLAILAVLPTACNILQVRLTHAPTSFASLWALLIVIILIGLLFKTLNLGIFGFLFEGIGRGVPSFFRWLFFAGRRWEGARYMGEVEATWFLRSSQKGWLVDGKRKRLSEKISYQSLLTVGGMGKGKSSVFVMPNLYTLDDRSMVVTDTSGEIYEQTVAYLKSKGFEIQTLNLMDLDASLAYNPLANVRSFTDIQQVAHLIIKSAPASANPSDPFWNSAAEKLLRIIIQALYNHNQPEKFNLAQVKYWVNEFETSGHSGSPSKLDEFILSACTNDDLLWQDYKGLLRGNEKALSSIVMTADVALSALSNPDIARFLTSNEIDFAALRQRKTILYVMVRQQDLSYYAFLLNLFYTDLFRHLLSERDPDHLPVYLLLDEFGHLTIPDFAVFATTARKYRVSFWIFLQSLSQLESRYGQQESKTILDGLATEIYMSGLGIETADMISKRVGRRRRRDKQEKSMYGEMSLLNPDEIISMDDDEVLLLHSNKRPIRYRVTPFYRQWWMKKASEG